jgi:hypothetical protein
MVHARLHIICGNCGCNNNFEYRAFDEDQDEEFSHIDVRITCNNCSTIHGLEDNAKEIVKD